MKEQKNYYVIGGQYLYLCHGTASTLIGAKRLATKCVEYWENCQSFRYPKIYEAKDIQEITSFDNECSTYVPKENAEPIATREWGDRWVTYEK